MSFISASNDLGFFVGANTNQTYVDGELLLWQFKSQLKTAGWTFAAYGTGTGGSSGKYSDIFTSASMFYTTASCWWLLVQPGSSRSLCFQHAATTAPSLTWKVKYSPGGFAISGALTVNQMPGPITALDELVLVGGGTDAAPTYATLFSTLVKWNSLVDNATPYGFWAASFVLGGGVGKPRQAFILDPLLSGSYPGTDTDPYVAYFGQAGSDNAVLDLSSLSQGSPATNMGAGYLKRGLAGQYIGSLKAGGFASKAASTAIVYLVAGNLTTNPLTNNDELLPVGWLNDSSVANPGWKGISTILRSLGSSRSTADTISTVGATTRDYIVYGTFALSWSGEVPST